MHSTEIRQKFLDFFQSKDHTIRPSSPLVPPPDDPTLLFTTAGMVQFKPLWAGAQLPFKRAATVQKCLRAGGKGSDLENVGKTLRHHTFFEMLGNFSFGDYFKKEAIQWAWDFLIDILKMEKENIWVSVYKDDDEAFNIWKDGIGIDTGKIVRLSEKDNFWGPAGMTGACGPCSEIYFDLGKARGCGKPDCQPGCACERYLEFWNLVFPQFYQNEDGSRRQLERRGIDTGMGLERLTFLLQRHTADNNYETDLFKPIVDKIKTFTPLETKSLTGFTNMKNNSSFHVIADHIRALTFSFSEGIMPSNEGRGYVLRRLLRRAVRHARKINITEPFLYKLVDTVIDVMKGAYPELADVSRIILSEEERFQHTIDYGLYMFEEIAKKVVSGTSFSGEDMFRLYDTYGFPLDLLGELAGERGLSLDFPGFEKLMNEQKERARQSWTGLGKATVNPVYSKIKPQEFVGYNTTRINTKVIAVLDGEIFLEKTPFYAESGGQVGDTGFLKTYKGEVSVLDTQRVMPGVISHKVRSGIFNVGDGVEAVVNEERRLSIARHHTATHLLQYCLREVLGDHVKQSGSLVAPHKLRFDFTHFADISEEELLRVEGLVNEKIMEDKEVNTYELPLQEALNSGVLAFFGEKYGERVRILDTGGYSKELCGGTHVNRTGQIGVFRITSEGSISAGVRRIEAVCGTAGLMLINEEKDRLNTIYKLLKAEPENTIKRIVELQDEHKRLFKEKEEKDMDGLKSKVDNILSKAKTIKGIKLITANLGSVSIEQMRSLSDILKDRIKSGIILLGGITDNKANLLAIVTQDLVDKGYHAGKIIKEVASIVEGTGGGKPTMAQAGGKKPELLDKALQFVSKLFSALWIMGEVFPDKFLQ